MIVTEISSRLLAVTNVMDTPGADTQRRKHRGDSGAFRDKLGLSDFEVNLTR